MRSRSAFGALCSYGQPPGGQLRVPFGDAVIGHLSFEPGRQLEKPALERHLRLVAEDAPGEGDVREAVADVPHAVFAGDLGLDVLATEDLAHGGGDLAHGVPAP